MLKGTYLRIFLTKAKWIVLLLLVLVLSFSNAVNIYITKVQKKLVSKINQKLNYTLSIGNLYYQFPNSFYFYDIGIKSNAPDNQNSSMDLSKIKVKLSVPELLSSKKILISDIKIYNSRLTYVDLKNFLSRNTAFFKNIFKNMPEGNAKIKFYDIVLIFLDNKEVKVDCFFKVNKNSLVGAGRFKKILYMKENLGKDKVRNFFDVRTYKFRIKSLISEGKLLIDSIDINNLNFHAKLWGAIDDKDLKINGYAFIDTFAKQKNSEVSTLTTLLKPIKDLIQNDIFLFQEGDFVNSNIHILDIDTSVSLSFPLIEIKKFNFTVNNTPIAVTGTLDIGSAMKADISCQVMPSNKMVFFKDSKAEVTIDTSNNRNKASGTFHINFKEGASDYSLSEINASFKDMIFDLDKIIPLEIFISYLKVVCKTKIDEHSIEISQLSGSINNLNNNLKIIDFISPFHSGRIKGRFWIKTNKWPADVSSTLQVEGVESNELANLYAYFAKIHGKLYGQVNFSSKKDMVLSGSLWIPKGRLANFDFFQWLSVSFDMPSLQQIYFDRASANFVINASSVNFDNFYLNSPNVSMKGYYRVDSHNLVSSMLNLSFSKDTLSESRKFKPILKIFNDSSSALPFKFQLSGNQENMNFYWMDSPVKQKIQDKIPNFIEKRIEKGINKMVNEPETP